MGRLILITGGARSGKSSFAEKLAAEMAQAEHAAFDEDSVSKHAGPDSGHACTAGHECGYSCTAGPGRGHSCVAGLDGGHSPIVEPDDRPSCVTRDSRDRSVTGEGHVTSVIYIATCIPGDDEMRQRVVIHKSRRPSHWKTVEEPLDLAGALRREGACSRVLLVDCLGLYVTNLLCQEATGTSQKDICQAVLGSVREFAGTARNVTAHVIVVSNEVGMGLVPEYPLGRLFRDTLGWANQILAEGSDKVYLMVSGIPVAVKS